MTIFPRSLSFIFLIVVLPHISIADDERWWPIQAIPKRIIRTTDQGRFPSPNLAYQNLVQSVAGLASKKVNSGQGEELIWVTTSNRDLEHWLQMVIQRDAAVEIAGPSEPWDLVDRFIKNKTISGYILYNADESARKDFAHSNDMNESVNVATSLAGLFDGILIDESLQTQAESRGLKLLIDARNLTQRDCFAKYKDRFNRRMLFCQDPKKSNSRDLSIAHQAFAVHGDDDLMPEVMKWLEPLSSIVGWNGGDEFQTTDLSSRYGHFQTATDWCVNLPVLMAGSEKRTPAKVPHVDPCNYDWNDNRSAISIVLTDGDNVQFMEGSFFSNHDFWESPDRGKIPFGWSCCFSHLTQVAPTIVEHAIATRSGNDEFLEWGGGYYYPDHFGKARSNRWELLSRHAAKTWAMMKRNDTRIIGFNVAKLDSKEAMESYEVFANQTDGLLAMFAFQYAPYEEGSGEIYWVKDRNGIEIPVITARYSIWENSNHRPRSGTPAKVAREIRETIAATESFPRYDWVIAHAWSYFSQRPGDDEAAENIPQLNATANGGIRGYTPTKWCAERLPDQIRVIGPEELAWRIRMKHNSAETKRLIDGI